MFDEREMEQTSDSAYNTLTPDQRSQTQVLNLKEENDSVEPYVDLGELSRVLDLEENRPVIQELINELEEFAKSHST